MENGTSTQNPPPQQFCFNEVTVKGAYLLPVCAMGHLKQEA